MNSRDEVKPEFFKIMLPEFEKKIRIPPSFVKHLDPNNRNATIWSSLGRAWNVEIDEGADGSLYFSKGWPEVARAHDLKHGYFVIFRREDDMHFTMKVFDLSCCRKDYSRPADNKGKEKEDVFTRTYYTRSKSNQSGPCIL